jgi:hypothetical protein
MQAKFFNLALRSGVEICLLTSGGGFSLFHQSSGNLPDPRVAIVHIRG